MAGVLSWVQELIKRTPLEHSRSNRRPGARANALPSIEDLENRLVPALGMSVFNIPDTGPLLKLVVGSDGNLWTGSLAAFPATLVRVTVEGQVTKYPVPDHAMLNSFLTDLTRGPDGNIWFSDWTWIGKLTPQGNFALYALPQDKGAGAIMATALATGSDGNVWFLEQSTNEVGRITPDGQVTLFTGATSLGMDNSGLTAHITAGADGNMWFTEPAVAKVGRIAPDGQITEFSVPSPNDKVDVLAKGPDGTLWGSVEDGVLQIGASGAMSVVAEEPGIGQPAIAPNGSIWFPTMGGVGMRDTKGNITEYRSLTGEISLAGIRNLTFGPDGALWGTPWIEQYNGTQVVRIDLTKSSPVVITPVQQVTATPGSTVHGEATVFDPNLYESTAVPIVSLDWGDGAAAGGAFGSYGVVEAKTISAYHVYQKEGVYSIRVTDELVPANQISSQQGGPVPILISSSQVQATIRYSPNAHFVMQLYNDLLVRNAETAGWQGWTAQLDSGVSRAQVVQEIEASPEYRNTVLTGYYQSILSRAPDAAGLAAWKDALAKGTSLEAVKAAFFASDEYQAQHQQGGVAGYLTALYHDILGRPIDPVGRNASLQALALGASPSQVVGVILVSPEANRLLIEGVYRQFLGRDASPSDSQNWLGFLSSGHDDTALLNGVLVSQEYFNRAVAHVR